MARGMEIDEKSMGGNASCPETQKFQNGRGGYKCVAGRQCS